MKIGNGDIGSSLLDRQMALIFASGVSNSNCNDEAEFQREHDLLYSLKDKDLCCIYFSTISIFDRVNPYILHKINMEESVKKYFDNYCIIRIGNIDWGTNPNTFLNFLRNKMKHGEFYEIRDETKYMISKDLLAMVVDNVPLVGQHELCVFGYKAKVKDIL